MTTAPARWPRLATALAVVGLVGVAISIYLTWTKLAGVPPICGPSGGCETVELSDYSSVAGIPVAAFGILYSGTVVLLALWWARTRDWRAGYAAYALGLAGVVVEAYLVYLQLFVIHAICYWCVAYGITILVGLVLASLMVRSQGRPAS